jgi:hypothetical protein
MLYHVSIEADDPRHVADVIAEIWGGVSAPFPAVTAGSWVAMAGDDRGTIIEVYPRGTQLVPGPEGAFGEAGAPRRNNPTHFAIASALDQDAVLAIARREGWQADHFLRGAAFGVIEIWIEGCQMIEVLTPEMQRQYLNAITIENWRRIVGERMPEAARTLLPSAYYPLH